MNKIKLYSLICFKYLIFNFPAILILIEILLIYNLLTRPSVFIFMLVLLVPYVIPLGIFRILNFFFPIKEGKSYLQKDTYSPWLAAHKLQYIYGMFPVLESLLLCVPGLFSFWLRLWGSKVGKGVVWAGKLEIIDRSHLDIGNNVFFGNKLYLSPHIVNPTKDGRFLLYYKTVKVGDNVFVGAACGFGPGVVVESNSFVPILTDLVLNEHFPKTGESSDTK